MPESPSFTLAPGVRLFAAPDGWLLALPGEEDRFVRVHAEPEGVRHLAERLSGRPAIESGEAADLLDRFVRAGYALPAEPPPAPPLAGRRIAIGGANPIAQALAEILRPLGAEVLAQREEVSPTAPSRSVDLAIVCSGFLRDAEFQAFDRTLRDRNLAWHVCYPEGRRWFLGPLCRPGGLSYADVRARRLAATYRPTELMALWRALDRGEAVGATPWPGPAACAALAAALSADAEAYLSGGVAPSDGYQLSFDPERFSWRRHPVLAVPRDLLAPDALEAPAGAFA